MTLHISHFIAQRISQTTHSAFSVLITRIAISSLAVGMAVVLLSFMIFKGFRQTIENKIFSLAAHLQVTKFTLNNSYEEQPLSIDRNLFLQFRTVDKNLLSAQSFSQKPALMRAKEEMLGVVLKGISSSFDTLRFLPNLIEGNLVVPTKDSIPSQEIVISKFIANQLDLVLGDKVVMYFIQDPPKVRKLTVKGIYATEIEDFDKKIILCDEQLIRQINEWADSLSGGYEFFVKDFENLDTTSDSVYSAMDYDMQITKVTDQYSHFFDWFIMLNRNVVIFLSIIIFVACFNVLSILLILIMERASMIGILKALGATNLQIQRVFFYQGIQILWKGLLIGNSLGLGLAWLQYQFALIPLDAQTYYMNTAPIAFDWQLIIWANLVVALLVLLVLYLPTYIIARISPVQVIRFD